MPQLEQLTAIPISPIYRQSRTNEAIDLGESDAVVTIGTKSRDATLQLTMTFLPKSRVSIFMPADSASPLSDMGAFKARDARIVLKENGVNFPALFRQFGTRIGGTIFNPTTSPLRLTPDTKSIRSAVFHIFNFPKFYGDQTFALTYNENSTRIVGRTILRADGWIITITEADNLEQLNDVLESEGGYALTHVGKIERADGSDFSSEMLSDQLFCLHHFLSMVIGRWAGVSLPIGFDGSGNWVFREIGIPITSSGSWHPSFSWFDGHHAEQIAESYPGFLSRWNDPLWCDAIKSAVFFYLSANDHVSGINIDAGLMLGQAALERLAWTYCVQDRKLVSAEAFKPGKLRAADKLRMLVTSFGIPVEIPPSMSDLKSMNCSPLVDGLDAIVAVRNSIVHPDAKHQPSHGATWDAWELSQWYLDLIFLKLCGHVGRYASRISRGTGVRLELVPWTK